MSKHWRKTGSKLILIAMLFSAIIPVYASSTQDKIDDVKQQQEQSKNRKEEVENKIRELEGYKADAVAYIQKMDIELAQVEENLEDLQNQKTVKEQEIVEAEAELLQARDIEHEQYESMKMRIQYMYENGTTSYLELFFTAESFADLLNKTEYISQITEYDRNMLEVYQQVVTDVEEKEARLEQENNELAVLIADVQAEQENLQLLIETKAQVIEEYEAQIADGEAEVSVLEADMEQLDNELAKLEEQLKKEQAKRTYDGGTLGFPVAWYYRISSDYGYRIHPIYGYSIFHSGVDLSADTGTAIYAAYGGTVVTSTYSSSAGNYIMIDHGSGLMTVYMHCSKLLVSVGQQVSKGETIALVGSTGNSTGPHLHFSVRLNGSYVDPKPYIGLN